MSKFKQGVPNEENAPELIDLHKMYEATCTDKEGNDEIESYEMWLERQLLSRIESVTHLRTRVEELEGELVKRTDSFSLSSKDYIALKEKADKWDAHERALKIVDKAFGIQANKDKRWKD